MKKVVGQFKTKKVILKEKQVKLEAFNSVLKIKSTFLQQLFTFDCAVRNEQDMCVLGISLKSYLVDDILGRVEFRSDDIDLGVLLCLGRPGQSLHSQMM